MSETPDRSSEDSLADGEATAEIAIPDAVLEPISPRRPAYRAPMWLTLALATVAIVALGVALASFNSSRELRDDWTAFQAEIVSSGEVAAGRSHRDIGRAVPAG